MGQLSPVACPWDTGDQATGRVDVPGGNSETDLREMPSLFVDTSDVSDLDTEVLSAFRDLTEPVFSAREIQVFAQCSCGSSSGLPGS